MTTEHAKSAERKNTDIPYVSVLGLGAMGSVLAGTLLEQGFRVTVWNRTAEKATPLAERGAAVAASPADAVAAAGNGGVIVVCLLDHTSVERTLADLDLTGRTVVNLTNGTPDQARGLAALLAGRGAEYLDGGIMATPPLIATPHAFIYYSGSRDVLESCRPVLEPLGAVDYAGSDPGAASLLDIALLSAMYGMFGGIAHAFALTTSGGVPAREVAGRLGDWLAGMGALIPDFAEQVDTQNFDTDVVSSLAMQLDAYENLLTTAKEQDVSPALLLPMRELLDRTVAAGGATSDTMAVTRLLRSAAPA